MTRCSTNYQTQIIMGQKSNIEWCDATWNIARGCTKVDEDCKACYMYRDSMNSTRYDPMAVVRTKTVFDLPLRIKEPSKIFTCSLTDFFHEAIDSYQHEAWDIIRRCPQHTFQILTKRPERIVECLPSDWGNGWPNVWLGTSCGSQKSYRRILDLLKVKANVKFLSVEPMWGSVALRDIYHVVGGGSASAFEDISGGKQWFDVLAGQMANGQIGYDCPKLDWVIVGGESGNETGKYRYRECDMSWIERVVEDCQATGVPVFVKQLGTFLSKARGMNDRHGGDISEFPLHLQIRQFPKQ